MGFLFDDGFDDYTDATQEYEVTVAPASVLYAGTWARFTPPSGLPGQGIKMQQNTMLQKNLAVNAPRLIGGVAWNPSTVANNNSQITVWLDNGTYQLSLQQMASGGFQFFRGGANNAAGTAVGSPSAGGLLTSNSWYFIEWDITIDPSAGVAKLYLNGNPTPIINSTGLNTRNTANSFANQFQMVKQNVAGFWLFDDLYLFDDQGTYCNAILGDQRIITKVPTGAGGLTQWTPNGAGANWQCVDEIPPNDDTDYVSSNTAGNRDAYAVPTSGITAAPNFFVVKNRARKDDAATRVMKGLVRSSSAVAVGGGITLGSNYTNYRTLFENDPNTSAHWTGANADAAQIGEEMTS